MNSISVKELSKKLDEGIKLAIEKGLVINIFETPEGREAIQQAQLKLIEKYYEDWKKNKDKK